MPEPLAIIAIIQARMSSSRLPGKVLLPIGDQPMLVRVVERARRAKTLTGLVVATTTDSSDDPIEQLCQARGYACVRGSLHDVLDRYHQAAQAANADLIVRITADCPLIDPEVIDAVVRLVSPDDEVDFDLDAGLSSGAPAPDFAASRLPPPWGRTFPIGLDVEVVTRAALGRAWREADQPFQREHVMPFFYEGIPADALRPLAAPPPADQPSWRYVLRAVSPRGFQVAQLHHYPDYGAYRWTVDTPADLELIRQLQARLDDRGLSTCQEQPPTAGDRAVAYLSWYRLLSLFAREPALAAINAEVQHKTAFDVDHRLPPRPGGYRPPGG